MHAIITTLAAILEPVFGDNVHAGRDALGSRLLRDAIVVDMPSAYLRVTVLHRGARRERPYEVVVSYGDGISDPHEVVNPSARVIKAWAERFIEKHGDEARELAKA